MINIKDIEEGVMIEVNEWNYPLSNLVSDITITGKGLSEKDIYKYTSNITASLCMEGYIKLQKTEYRETSRGSYEPVSSRDLTEEETDYILKNPDKWDEETIMDPESVFEFAVTEKGRSYFK